MKAKNFNVFVCHGDKRTNTHTKKGTIVISSRRLVISFAARSLATSKAVLCWVNVGLRKKNRARGCYWVFANSKLPKGSVAFFSLLVAVGRRIGLQKKSFFKKDIATLFRLF